MDAGKSFAGSRKIFAALEEGFEENFAALEEDSSLLPTKRLLSVPPPAGERDGHIATVSNK